MFTFIMQIAVRLLCVSQNLLHARSNSGMYLCQKSIYSVFTYSKSVVERKSKQLQISVLNGRVHFKTVEILKSLNQVHTLLTVLEIAQIGANQ